MTVRVITGSKQQIAEQGARLPGEVREAIVFIDEAPAPSSGSETRPSTGAAGSVEDLFAEMGPYMADAGDVAVDDSRDAIYERQEGE
jgi:hypothetical protein